MEETQDKSQLSNKRGVIKEVAESHQTLGETQSSGKEGQQAEQTISPGEARYRQLIENLHTGVVVHAPDTSITLHNRMAHKILGLTEDQMLGKTAADPGWRFVREDGTSVPLEEYPVNQVISTQSPVTEYVLGIKRPVTDDLIWVLVNAYPALDDQHSLAHVTVTFEDITRRIQAEQALQESENRLKQAQELGRIGHWIYDVDTQSVTWSDQVYQLYERDPSLGPPTAEEEAGYYSPEQTAILREYSRRAIAEGQSFQYEIECRLASGSVFFAATMQPEKDQHGRVIRLVGTVQDITEQAQAKAKLTDLVAAEQQRAGRLYNLQRVSLRLANLRSETEVMEVVVEEARELADSPACSIMLIDAGTNEAWLAAQSGLPAGTPLGLRIPLELPILEQALEAGQPLLIADIDQEAPELRQLLVHPQVRAFYAYPLLQEERVAGFITLSSLSARLPSDEEVVTLSLLAERAALALQNAHLFEEAQSGLQRLASLRAVDMAISSGLDISLTLGLVLEQALQQLGVDAAGIMLLDPNTQYFRSVARRGFRTSALQHSSLTLGEGIAGRAALERCTIVVENLAEDHAAFKKSPHFSKEGFISLVSTPLVAKGQVLGVLEAFQRATIKPSADWLDFLETLAGQAAIAIDSLQLFDHLQRSNAEMAAAYQATIAGWSRALELRDQETEGHSRRVTATTLQLAKAFEVSAADLIHIQRGALLHDIGKMGIPDGILLKPGPLTDEEWIIMRGHPQLAYDMLSPVDYLKPALEIPYCHHEKWDGTGYPRALKGEEIPLAARLFAVVDVWDALTSERPYRAAWPDEKALAYVIEQSGSHFEPRVVAAFVRITQRDAPEEKTTILIVDDEVEVAEILAADLSDRYEVLTANSGSAALDIVAQSQVAAILTDYAMPGMNGIQLLEQVEQTHPEIVGILFSGQINQQILSSAINMANVRGFISKPCDTAAIHQRLTEALKDSRWGRGDSSKG
jgi:PAS domain S-box-containing protein